MVERQRRRLSWPHVAAVVVPPWVGVPVWLHFHNRFDLFAFFGALCVVILTFGAFAVKVICDFIVNNHEVSVAHQARQRRLEEAADNVVPLRRNPVDEDTTVLPFVAVGRAQPVVGGGASRPTKGLTFTAGDHTIDCALRDELEGNTG